jgi:hypothetical protein
MPGRRDRVVRGLPGPESAEPVAAPSADERDRPVSPSDERGGELDRQAGSDRRSSGRSRAASEASVPAGAEEGDAAPVASLYSGVARSPRTLRIYDPLYARVGALVRALEDEGYSTDRTELIQALLHFELPADVAGARKLLRRWRRYLAE